MAFTVNTLLAATLLLVVANLYTTHGVALPDFIKVCSRNDPKLADCFINTVHEMRPYLRKGIPELNVPPMEPIFLGDLNVLDGGAGGLHAVARKLKAYGAADFEITKMTVNKDGKRFDFDLLLPHLRVVGKYQMNGNLLALPLKGNGPFSGNFSNFRASVKLELDVKKIGNEDYANVKDLEVKVRTGTGSLRLDNLFNGDKVLGDVINDTINQNFVAFVNELIGPIEKALSKKFGSIAAKVVENFTFDQLFPH